jgi:EAL domain-containing protein (putative c-di-GMP-specific phosphodiesterase class I)/ActR/RegA family two-component response regulator
MHIIDMKFLVAEDDAFQRRWLAIMLTNLGVKNIIEAADGLEALKILQGRQTPIDVSIIDLNMPGMDGVELIRHIANGNHPGSIILVSALDRALLFSVETMSKAYGVDLLGTIEKPATPDTLLELLKLYRPRTDRPGVAKPLPSLTATDIRSAVKERQFEPWFQPKVEIATGQVKGAEAFTRWVHPEYGSIAPSVFIPLLEQCGEMGAFASIVIEKSLDACVGWHARGFPISVSINLAPSCIEDAGFAEQFIALAAARNIGPQHIIIEVTESSAIIDAPHFLENLVRLRMHGFGISVDDYGTGHSSLKQLLRIPFSELKIDRSFVAGASANAAMEAVLCASLDVCRKLNKQSVAVGVETQQDWNLLLKLGCTYAQGYYIAKPMDGASLPLWMDEWAQFF